MRCIHELIEVPRRAVLDGAATDHDVLELAFVRRFAGVEGVFVKGGRLGVGVGKRWAVQRRRNGGSVSREQAEAGHLVGREACRHGRAQAQLLPARVLGLLGFLLRNLPVLAIKAAEDAAGSGEGKGAAARQEMKQRLLLYRIYVERAGVRIDQRVEGTVVVDLVAAMAAVAGREQAVVGADLALDVAAQLEVVRGLLDPAALAPEFPQFAFRRVTFEYVGRRFRRAPFGEEIEQRSRSREPRDARRPDPNRRPPRQGPIRAPSDFGFRPSFGLRASSFGLFCHRSSRCLIQPHRCMARYTAGTLCTSTRTISGR